MQLPRRVLKTRKGGKMKRRVRTGRKRTAVKFSGRKRSVQGMVATGIGVLTILLAVVSIWISSRASGMAGVFLGFLGLVVVALAIAGVWIAIRSFKEKDIFYTFPAIGFILNGIVLIGFVVIYFIGLSI